MKIKVHLVNGEIIKSSDDFMNKEKFIEGIKDLNSGYAALEFDNSIVFFKNIMYIEMEE